MDKMASTINTSITELYDKMIVSLTGDLTDDEIYGISQAVMSRSHKRNLKGAIFNFSAVHVLDSFAYEHFEKTSKSLSFMGVKVVWIGLRPGLIMGLMDLNIQVDTAVISTALNLEQGFELLDMC
jgi:rsbT antagonist protein RsbS